MQKLFSTLKGIFYLISKKTFFGAFVFFLITSVWYVIDSYQGIRNQYISINKEIFYKEDDYLEEILKNYAEKIEEENPELAKKFYASNDGDRAVNSIIDKLKDKLFLYSDKYGNLHQFRLRKMYQLRQDEYGVYNNRLYINQCNWLAKVEYGRNWHAENCSENPLKVEGGTFIGSLISNALDNEKKNNLEIENDASNFAFEESLKKLLFLISTSLFVALLFSVVVLKFDYLKNICNMSIEFIRSKFKKQ